MPDAPNAARGRSFIAPSTSLSLRWLRCSAIVFVFAFAVIHHFSPPHALWLEFGALCGFALSALVWLIVAVSTPAPLVVKDAAMSGARNLHDRLPENLRDRLPEELRVRISGGH